MVTAKEYLEKNPDILLNPAPIKKAWALVFKKATRHTRRLDRDSLFDEVRPNESELVKKYRNNSKRWITCAPVERFQTKVSRIIQDSGAGVKNESEELLNWLKYDRFECLGSAVPLDVYLFDVIFSRAIEDPNSVWVAFPYNAENPNTPPAYAVQDGGLRTSDKISIDPKIISHKDVVIANADVFAFKGGQMPVKTTGNNVVMKDFFYMADKKLWYRITPIYDKDTGTFKHQIEDWYLHNTGENEYKLELPINFLPGSLKTFHEQEELKYNESFLLPYFELADEAASRFSDNQAVAVQHAFPKVVLKEIPCQAEGCEEGQVWSYDKDKKKILDSKRTCGACKGEGYMTSVDPYSVLIAPKQTAFDKDNNSPVMEYISPDGNILEHSYKTPFDLLQRASRQIGLDILMDLNESGVAKGHRLEDLQDILRRIAYNLLKCQERFLWHVECLLNPNFNDRQYPTVLVPVNYRVKDLTILQEEAKNSLPVDRLESHLSVVKEKYFGNQVMIKVMELALMYCPLLLHEGEDLKTCLLLSSNPEKECIKRDRSIWAFKKLSERASFLNDSDEKLFQEANKLIAPYLPSDRIEINSVNQNQLENERNQNTP